MLDITEGATSQVQHTGLIRLSTFSVNALLSKAGRATGKVKTRSCSHSSLQVPQPESQAWARGGNSVELGQQVNFTEVKSAMSYVCVLIYNQLCKSTDVDFTAYEDFLRNVILQFWKLKMLMKGPLLWELATFIIGSEQDSSFFLGHDQQSRG